MAATTTITDCHCHLAMLEDAEGKISRAGAAGIGRFVTSALDEGGLEASLSLAKRFPGKVLVTLGLDPDDPGEVAAFERRAKLIRKNAKDLCGIGEAGLDFMHNGDREAQRRAFSAMISLSSELALPLTVHSRSAGKYAVGQLISEGAGKVLMHAFDGRPYYALQGAKAGFLFSIPPSVVFSGQKQELVKALPIESIVLESDTPSLGPVRGEPNEPANIAFAVDKMCELRKIGKEELLAQVGLNVSKLYSP